MWSDQMPKMKLFQSTQSDFVYLGIGPYDPKQKNQFNGLIFLYTLLSIMCFTQTGTFLVLEANTFEEYTEGIYLLSASILSVMAVTSIALKLQTLFNVIERCESFFESSKWKHLYWFEKRNVWKEITFCMNVNFLTKFYRNEISGFKRTLRGSCSTSGTLE